MALKVINRNGWHGVASSHGMAARTHRHRNNGAAATWRMASGGGMAYENDGVSGAASPKAASSLSAAHRQHAASISESGAATQRQQMARK